MRFSETPVTDDLSSAVPPRSIPVSEAAVDGAGLVEHREESQSAAPQNPTPERSPAERDRARKIIEAIGCEFVKLRKHGRPQAFSDLEDQLMANAHVLIESGLMTVDQWVKTTISLEEYRRAEGGNVDSPGDILAKWLTEDDVVTKPKKSKKVTQ